MLAKFVLENMAAKKFQKSSQKWKKTRLKKRSLLLRGKGARRRARESKRIQELGGKVKRDSRVTTLFIGDAST